MYKLAKILARTWLREALLRARSALSMMDVKGMDEDTVTWVRAIEALPVVSLLSLLTKKSRIRITLRCYESCGEKWCGPVCISKTHSTLLAAVYPTDHGERERKR